MNNPSARHQLDLLFAIDAVVSMFFGILSILAPHGAMAKIGGGNYNHSVHETLRYAATCVMICSFVANFLVVSLCTVLCGNSQTSCFRLYGCLRLACGWILWHVRAVDDGRFRKHICEALFVCYVLQALAVARAQFTDRHSTINWIAIFVLVTLSAAYGSHRFRRGGNLIKIYELPTSGTLR